MHSSMNSEFRTCHSSQGPPTEMETHLSPVYTGAFWTDATQLLSCWYTDPKRRFIAPSYLTVSYFGDWSRRVATDQTPGIHVADSMQLNRLIASRCSKKVPMYLANITESRDMLCIRQTVLDPDILCCETCWPIATYYIAPRT